MRLEGEVDAIGRECEYVTWRRGGAVGHSTILHSAILHSAILHSTILDSTILTTRAVVAGSVVGRVVGSSTLCAAACGRAVHRALASLSLIEAHSRRRLGRRSVGRQSVASFGELEACALSCEGGCSAVAKQQPREHSSMHQRKTDGSLQKNSVTMLHAGLKHQHAQLRVATRHSCGPAEGKRWRAAHASFMCDEMFTATILKIAADYLVCVTGTI